MDILENQIVKEVIAKFAEPLMKQLIKISKDEWEKFKIDFDIVFTKYKLAIFCDAEFWHGKDWDILKAKLLKGKNPEYWVPKIQRTRERDAEAERELQLMGWTVLRFWREEILKNLEQCVQTIEDTLFEIHLDCYESEYGNDYEDDL